MVRGKRVYVGLSGGVDSAVSAVLLQEAGAEVTGVFIKGWYPPGMPCTWAEDRRDAMRVAARLGIPFLTLDARSEYKSSVIDYLLAEYRAGRTPNPDVMCNRDVKFGAFYAFAKERGADHIATGHYRSGEKDQSYFLWAVPKEILAEAVFPVGELPKERVRAYARARRLPVAEKKDSQGVCFLGAVSIDDFLKQEFGASAGTARTAQGEVVGMHEGAILYTLGERAALYGGKPGPWYVHSKDIAGNELVVGKTPRMENVPGTEVVSFAQENWHADCQGEIEAQCRYRGALVKGRVEGNRFIAQEDFPEPPAPGQSIVFFKERQLLGGGIICG